MSDVTATTENAVLTVSATGAPLNPQTPTKAQENANNDPSVDPAWVKERLQRDRKQFLKELGIENPDEIKDLAAQAKATKEAAKTDAQKLGSLEKTLEGERAKITELNEALGVLAKSQMTSLTEAQRNAVAGIAGDDPAKQIKTIEALRSTWTSTTTSASATVAEMPRATAVQPNAPASVSTTTQQIDPRETWKELKEVNPIAAARYALENGIFNSK